jgi:hypothetical protein
MTRRARTRAAHVLLLLAGVAALVYALTLGGSPEIRCRGVAMAPGSVCVKADGSEGQTYEQRLATRRSAQPVVGGLGVLVAGFGAALLVADLRHRPAAGTGSAVEDAG